MECSRIEGHRCIAPAVVRSRLPLLIDIGINDVGFAGWAAGIILQDPVLRGAAGAMNPCFDSASDCAETRNLFAKLERRYGLLRSVLDQYLLPDFGIDPSHVIVAVYPPALENEAGVFCQQGNAGLTIATFPPAPFANACSGVSAPITFGTLAEYPASDQAERNVEQARVKLNASLAAFALQPHAEFDLIKGYTSDFSRRGVCATTDARSGPPAGQACFTTVDLFNLPCAPNPESLHLPRTGPLSSACQGDASAFGLTSLFSRSSGPGLTPFFACGRGASPGSVASGDPSSTAMASNRPP